MKKKNPIKKYELPLNNKVSIVFENCECGMPVIESLKSAKFQTVDEFADRLMLHHEKDHSKNQDFLFTINLETELVKQLREYLIKRKKFIFEYITSQEHFINSHIYQLYLQYIPYELTDVEKSIFLDAYINMATDLRGKVISEEKRKRLEKSLHINQG